MYKISYNVIFNNKNVYYVFLCIFMYNETLIIVEMISDRDILLGL